MFLLRRGVPGARRLSVVTGNQPVMTGWFADRLKTALNRPLIDVYQVQKRSINFDSFTHSPHLSCLLKKKMTTKLQVPLAVMKGAPLRPEQTQDVDPENDILVIREGEQKWTPPNTKQTVLCSPVYNVWQKVLDMATRNMISRDFETEDEDEESILNEAELAIFMEIVSSTVKDAKGNTDQFDLMLENFIDFALFIKYIKRAVRLEWPNGEARIALTALMQAACDVCNKHATQWRRTMAGSNNNFTMNEYLGIPIIVSDALNIGGGSPKNLATSRYAMKTVKSSLHDLPSSFQDKSDILRDPEMWVSRDRLEYGSEEEDDEGEETTDQKIWQLRNVIPDAVIEIGQFITNPNFDTKRAGWIVGETKSCDYSPWAAVDQSVVQALRGLLYRPSTAALVMSPKVAVFTDIAIECGFINIRKKRYYLVAQGEEVDPTAYQELFHDLVLYLWNTYYENQC